MGVPGGIRERMGVDSLLGDARAEQPGGSGEAAQQSKPIQQGQLSSADVSIRAYAPKRILQVVRDLDQATEGNGVWLEQVADAAQMDEEILLPLARRLEDAGLLDVVERKWANDLVKLGKTGAEVLAKSDDSELVRLL